MNFLRQEVKGEEMVLLARTGLTPHQNPRKKDYHATQVNKVETTTAAALVNMDNPGQEKLIRAVIDSGSQSTYVSENVITHLKALPLRGETVIHALFGGSETKPKKHDIFPVEETEINLLIGADVLGKLLTGNSVELESGLTAVETKLGWTVFGKGSCVKDNIVTTLSMHSMNIPVNKLWELENYKILPDGRYEVELPWKYDSLKLPSNKELVWKRHEGMINRFGCGKFFMDYQKVFQDWEKLNIIERVPDLELNKECHYLAHRPVIKLDSQTTKIRPVFDASASEKGKPSLNECLLQGTNLIELIPDILDRFRMYPIGISAVIEKAFLMLSVAPKDRDFLIFFPSSEGRIVYRHCRVVFGVSSSPFLLNASIMHLLENCQPQHEEVAQKLKSSFYVDNCVSGVFNTDEQGRFIEHAKLIMLNGCFNLRGFESNVAGKNVDRNSGDTSVLGVIWNLETDTF
ncbi:DUF1758 domain-containing protein [Trichonephila clavipes]|nr:DUF1758 domain-containing protein [Trichonephila clavipes]